MSDDRICELCNGPRIVDGRACPNCGVVFAAPPGERPKPRADRPPQRRSPPLVPKNSSHRQVASPRFPPPLTVEDLWTWNFLTRIIGSIEVPPQSATSPS